MTYRMKFESEYNKNDTVILEVGAGNAGSAVSSAKAHIKRNMPSMGNAQLVWKISVNN